VSVVTFWNALKAAGIAYNPKITGDSKESESQTQSAMSCITPSDPLTENDHRDGVFPLTYLNGVDGIFIAIAETSERAIELYERAHDIIIGLEA
jgi:hypothetical protein